MGRSRRGRVEPLGISCPSSGIAGSCREDVRTEWGSDQDVKGACIPEPGKLCIASVRRIAYVDGAQEQFEPTSLANRSAHIGCQLGQSKLMWNVRHAGQPTNHPATGC
jgi:hypothetical protein